MTAGRTSPVGGTGAKLQVVTWRLAALPLIVAAIFVGVSFGSSAGAVLGPSAPVIVIQLDRPIDKVSARFLEHALDNARREHATVAVIRIDTPGGLLDSTRDMVGAIFASPVPVVAYVAPEGAQAASAGTFVASAAALLAMAPATNIGAAAVVGSGGQELPKTLSRKATEDAAAFIRSIAKRRGRPVAPLEATVRSARAYSATEALSLGIADRVSPALDQLLRSLDGRKLQAARGARFVRTTAAPIHVEKMGLLERILSFLADPNIAFLLISLGTLALAVEIWSPGLWVPGALGIMSLVLGFAGLGNLPFSWAAIVLLGLGVLFFVLEALHPGVGLFGAFGTASFVLGGILMIGGSPEFPGEALQVSRWLLAAIGVVGLTFAVLLVREVRLSHRPAYVSPYARERIVGELAEVSVRLAPRGEVRLAGESWSAELRGAPSAEAGERVRVAALSELGLVVEPVGGEQNGTAVERAEAGR
jgi:membrane-bound serine protease (ClpP class)